MQQTCKVLNYEKKSDLLNSIHKSKIIVKTSRIIGIYMSIVQIGF